MIDTLAAYKKEISAASILNDLQLIRGQYMLITMHRPSTVDHIGGLNNLLGLLNMISEKNKIVFPIHPRTLNNFEKFNLKGELHGIKNLVVTEPLDYFSFQNLILNSKFVLTDSGGIQEETTYYKIPCITLRPNTERPVTCSVGSNMLSNFNLTEIEDMINKINIGRYKKSRVPKWWDGKSSDRLIEVIMSLIEKNKI